MLDLKVLQNQYKEYGTLPVAPTREAVFGFHFAESVGSDYSTLLETSLPQYDWSKLVPTTGSVVINMLTNEATHTQEQDHLNTQYRGDFRDPQPHSTETLIIKQGSFTYHLQGRYSTWEAFFGRANEQWQAVSRLMGLTLLCHSVRFVNEVAQNKTLQNYYPVLNTPSGLELNHLTYESSSLSKVPSLANFIQVMSHFWPTGRGVQGEATGSFILDISISPDLSKKEDELWATPDELRVLKNYFFFSSLPPQVLALCR